ncbi:flagellar protein FlaG [Sulfidibacter corallicola]|uniref:Flagellar protein FlaG n=1 Tax=Sulfidibacter corallicola TaxID=2818388 RepID=A0A8A4TTI1_SULCO|nr:flagellar protein FlaG [Sulfidibacter corallicola]QTD53269.1 flagellar protein FlaG [Sulfidibacter corallicola]
MTLLTGATGTLDQIQVPGANTARKPGSSPSSLTSSNLNPEGGGSFKEEGIAPTASQPGEVTAIQDTTDNQAPSTTIQEEPQQLAANAELIESLQEELRTKDLERRQEISQDISNQLNRNIKLKFSVDEETGTNVFQVIDRETGDIIKRYPPEEFLNFVKNFKAVSGILFSEQV